MNEPAFPALRILHDAVSNESGMLLRDYFAAKAMQATIVSAIAGRPEGEKALETMWTVAEGAYAMADLMLKARKA